jgi:hypothetical protein
MKNLFLKIHIHLILARKFAKARKERRDIDRQRKAFETDQARVDARITGPAVTDRIAPVEHQLPDSPRDVPGQLERLPAG